MKEGREAAIDEHECLKWLDSKEPNSVVWIRDLKEFEMTSFFKRILID